MVISKEILFDELETYVRHRGGKLLSLNIIDSEHQKSMWYGEKAAVIEYEGYVLDISAVGKITAIFSKNNHSSVITKSRGSDFYNEMKPYIRSDVSLSKLCGKYGPLTILAENRWECVLHLPDVDENRTITIALDHGETIEETVRYVANGMSEIIEFAEMKIEKRKE